MNRFASFTDIQLFSLVKADGREAFDELYYRYWEKLFNYAYHRMHSKDVAFEIVQDIFVSVWSRREAIELESSLSGYLFASVRFQIINYIRTSRQRDTYFREYTNFISSYAQIVLANVTMRVSNLWLVPC
jgi:RNA polymerase sigma factor (sigma-70 family)